MTRTLVDILLFHSESPPYPTSPFPLQEKCCFVDGDQTVLLKEEFSNSVFLQRDIMGPFVL